MPGRHPGPSRVFVAFLERCGRCAPWQILALASGWLALVATGDYYTGHEIGSSIFYLPAILLVGWFIGRRSAVLFSLLAAAAWGAANLLAGDPATGAVQVWNTFVRWLLFLTAVVLLTELHRVLLREQEMARTDALTGVFNQRAFYESLEQEISRARRYGTAFTLAYCDLDRFKEVNDSFGHAAGDEALRIVAATFREHLRNSDIVGRLGGDEFGVVLVQSTAESAAQKLDVLRGVLGEKMRSADWPITCSVGAVTFIHPPDSVAAALREADQLMYSVKTTGKNRIAHVTHGLALAAGRS